MELFREHNVSPFGSCLPMLLPLPVFFGLYRVITGLSHTAPTAWPSPSTCRPSTQMYKDIVAADGHLKAFGMDLSLNAFSPHSSVLGGPALLDPGAGHGRHRLSAVVPDDVAQSGGGPATRRCG